MGPIRAMETEKVFGKWVPYGTPYLKNKIF